MMIRRGVFLVILIVGSAATVFAAAQLLPEHQQRIGTCPGGGACAWDCNGSQCDLGFDKQICEIDADCASSSSFCFAGPICDGGSRSACELPLLATFPGHLVVRVDDNDALCAPLGTGCNQTTDDDCGSKVTIALRARKPDASEFVVRKDINLCNTGATACNQVGDCNQCLSGGSNCPRPDPVFLCNGQGETDIHEDDVDVFGQFTSWLNDIQPVTFLASSLPAELRTGIPVVLSAAQTASGKFCTGTDPRTTCADDAECSGGSCYAEAEYCVTVGLIRGRCLGGTNAGTLCASGGECDSGNCGIAGVPDISPLVTDDTDVTVADLGTCGGGCPSSADATCESAFDKCLLVVDESKAGKEKLVASWQKGPALAPAGFANPTVALGTAYDLCAYDQSGTLAGQWQIDRAGATCGDKPCWKALAKGFRYKDKAGIAQGIQSVLLKADEAGKSKLVVKGKNNVAKGQTSLPTGIAAALTGSANATIQLRGSNAPGCFSCAVTTSKDDEGKFKAKK
jgi:hypothetical protein